MDTGVLAGDLREYSYAEDDGFTGAQQSLRSRRFSSQTVSQHGSQVDGNPTTEEKKEEDDSDLTVRGSLLPMHLKRAVRMEEMQSQGVTQIDSWDLRKDIFLRKFKSSVREFISTYGLWNKSIQQIGGNFGGGVQSYFYLLRFLVVLNLCSFVLIAAFVIIPSTVKADRKSFFNITDLKEGIRLECMQYDPNPGGLVPFYNYFLDILSGTGFFENTTLFYGFYENAFVGSISYNIPLAYIFTAGSYFIFCLICITVRMGSAMRVAVETGGSSVGNFREIVFTSWDFGCLGDRATKLKQKNILYQLRIELDSDKRKKEAAAMTLTEKVFLYSIRAAMFVFTLSLIGGALVGIFFATTASQENSNEEGILGLIYEYLPSIAITAGNSVVPPICDQIAHLENYSPSNTVIVALLRAVFLRLAGLGVFLYPLWAQFTCYGEEIPTNCEVCKYNKSYQCWETLLGQEMYKLVLFDFLSYIGALVLVEFPRRMVVESWTNKLTKWVGRQEFEVPSNLLGLVYDQTVSWTGAFFCPLLPLITTIKLFILFYCQRINLFNNCQPEVKIFRTTTSTFVFLVVLLFGGGFAAVVLIYGLSEIHPSYGCGPFRSFSSMWSVVPESFKGLPETSQEFFFFIGSQAFSIPLFVITCLVLVYSVALASVHQRSVALLRKQLTEGRNDKKFLVEQIKELNLNSETSGEDSESLD